MTCTKAPGSFALPDPLRNLPGPTKPALAPAMHPVGHTSTPPKNCPGGSPAPSEGSPQLCALSPSGSYKNKAWVLFPGLYPGGLDVDQGTTAYLMPGIYDWRWRPERRDGPFDSSRSLRKPTPRHR